MLTRKKIATVLDRLEETYRETTTALEFTNPFQLLISTMLAAQSTDVRVNIVTRDIFPDYPDAKSMARLTVAELEEMIKSIGLYKAKARNIVATCHLLMEKYNGEIPMTREALMELPGVGRKTANVVISIAGDVAAIAVDTHVFRVSNRIGLAAAGDVLKTEEQLMKNIPREKWSDAHHWLIWHGRKICKARNPLCGECFLTDTCRHYRNGNYS
jgi:endonuclease-3